MYRNRYSCDFVFSTHKSNKKANNATIRSPRKYWQKRHTHTHNKENLLEIRTMRTYVGSQACARAHFPYDQKIKILASNRSQFYLSIWLFLVQTLTKNVHTTGCLFMRNFVEHTNILPKKNNSLESHHIKIASYQIKSNRIKFKH